MTVAATPVLAAVGVRWLTGAELESAAADFSDRRFVVVRGALDHTVTEAYRRYIVMQIAKGAFRFDDPASHRWNRYREPVAETLLMQAAEPLGAIVDRTLIPTYSYTVVYPPGAELAPHTDRAACEFSVSLALGNRRSGDEVEPWPLYVTPPGASTAMIMLAPGDLVLYRGCEVAHWREPQAAECHHYSVLLHFVDASGPSRDYAWDRSPA
jgi:hypothetical protein